MCIGNIKNILPFSWLDIRRIIRIIKIFIQADIVEGKIGKGDIIKSTTIDNVREVLRSLQHQLALVPRE